MPIDRNAASAFSLGAIASTLPAAFAGVSRVVTRATDQDMRSHFWKEIRSCRSTPIVDRVVLTRFMDVLTTCFDLEKDSCVGFTDCIASRDRELSYLTSNCPGITAIPVCGSHSSIRSPAVPNITAPRETSSGIPVVFLFFVVFLISAASSVVISRAWSHRVPPCDYEPANYELMYFGGPVRRLSHRWENDHGSSIEMSTLGSSSQDPGSRAVLSENSDQAPAPAPGSDSGGGSGDMSGGETTKIPEPRFIPLEVLPQGGEVKGREEAASCR